MSNLATSALVAELALSTPVAQPLACKRGRYDKIVSLTNGEAPANIMKRFAAALPELGIESMSLHGRARRTHGNGGWLAVNADLYGYDPAQGVAVVQIRQSETGGYGIETRKTYALIGFNETGTPFRHPVSASAVRGAIRANDGDPKWVVKRVQMWMWAATERQLDEAFARGGRQGDVLLVKVRGEPNGAAMEGVQAVLGGSHVIRAARVIREGEAADRVLALNPTVYHAKEQHDPVGAWDDGWYSVRLAGEAAAWTFGARYGD